jgi:DNA invertase Pin-like site-specific DNA recombinase
MDLGVDTNTAMGRAFLTNAATYAELEKNLISERTKEALTQIRIDGGSLGAPPYGWKYAEERDAKGRKQTVPVHDELKTVHECLTLRDLGFTYRQIADKFNSEGIPSKRGGKWHASAVRYCYINAKKQR